jgi:8-amino-7-oxononanoate synthase
MSQFEADLQSRLTEIRGQDLFRQLRWLDSGHGHQVQIADKWYINFSSNDYLGLINHPELKEAAIHATEKYGTGAGASRLAGGSLVLFRELEEALAAFKGTQAALVFTSGYSAASGTISALISKDDIIIVDKLVHACIVDAARLSKAKIRVFGHNDMNGLEDRLKWAATATPAESGARKRRVLVVTESIFSMDGDRAPLREIVALKEKYGAWLMVDEAHATGVVGRGGRGLADELGVSQQIEIHMGTMGKALGSGGGFICGSRMLIDFLINSARSFVFSTAAVPAAAAAANKALQIIQSDEGDRRRVALMERVSEFNRLRQKTNAHPDSAIVPVIVGDEAAAMSLAEKMFHKQLLVPAIRYPTVARGSARLRVTFTAAHSRADAQLLAETLKA